MKRALLFIVNIIIASTTIMAADGYSFSVSQLSMKPGSTADLAIEMKNAAAITGFQCDITLPEGLVFVEETQPHFTSGRNTNAHTLAYYKQASGAIRVVAYSMSLATFPGSEGAVFALPVKADQNLTTGTLTVRIDNILMAQTNGSEVGAPAYQGSVNILYADAASVAISQTEASLKIGESVQLSATVQPTNAEQKIEWSSSDNTVATVSANGLVNAVGAGQATITATSGAATASCTINVEKLAQEIVWDQEFEPMMINDKVELTATATSGLAVSYTITEGTEKASIDNAIVTILESGTFVVTASQDGNATYLPAQSVSKTISVIDTAIDGIAINGNDTVAVSTLAGVTMYKGLKKNMPEMPKGIYIIRYAGKVIKVRL